MPTLDAQIRELVQAQVQQALRPVRQELDDLDEWANGLFVVLADTLTLLQVHQPELAQQLQQRWAKAAAQYPTAGVATTEHRESRNRLEARKMLHELMQLTQPKPPSARE